MTYQETLTYLYEQLPAFQRIGGAAYKADLKNITQLCKLLGNPQKQFPSVHVAGTNGKGSTCHFLASILQEAGYRIGLTTSPHLRSFTERIRINGQEIAEESVVAFVEEIQPHLQKVQPSFFEIAVAMAFWYFAQQKVEIAIVEVGLGGRLDSTNIIYPLLSVITAIGYDHQQFLGNTLAEIAAEKAGIIKSEVPVIITEKHPETRPAFEQKAIAEGSTLLFAEDFYEVTYGLSGYFSAKNKITLKNEVYQLGLSGQYQEKNLGGVLKAIDILQAQFPVEATHIQAGLAKVVQNTGIKGRWQLLQERPTVVCDTAHNEAALKVVMQQIKQHAYQQLHLVMGFMKDKAVDKLLDLLPKQAHYYLCQPALQRALSVEALLQKATERGLRATTHQSVVEAIQAAQEAAQPDDFIYIGGSTFVVAEIPNL
ncbi:MAG: bifunctional folylpolyglutamate synthase/dihydrofolate synthase [Thermonemataceae bacterium]